MLQRNVHTEVMKRLHELFRVNGALKGDKITVRKVEDKTKTSHRQPHTCIPSVQTFHHELQVLLVILEIVNKLVKLQLPIRFMFFPF